MEQRVYKNPPLNEMYLGVHFFSDPPVGNLDFHQFSEEVSGSFEKKEYIHSKTISPEKIVFISTDDTRVLQFGRDRLIYNWRQDLNNSSSYPKFEKLKPGVSKILGATIKLF